MKTMKTMKTKSVCTSTTASVPMMVHESSNTSKSPPTTATISSTPAAPFSSARAICTGCIMISFCITAGGMGRVVALRTPIALSFRSPNAPPYSISSVFTKKASVLARVSSSANLPAFAYSTTFRRCVTVGERLFMSTMTLMVCRFSLPKPSLLMLLVTLYLHSEAM
eukprot:CAMPEP_0173228046 /NCGR_PEP_ID=MMETSP1142-20121109/6303_1 /TAXON_ID=483371 /ORGANISM="non described non described, Strain CCMP2298" /LENGTH=166 /DNA_ID=CAMNT_0014156633 /DNA_START=694 /DNA_END=1194 /DNA_ORIENTATION=-